MHSTTFLLLVLVAFCYVQENEAVCSKVYERGVPSDQKTFIVNRHNNIRLQAAKGVLKPKAANMKRMSWDNKLASEAQKIADTCVYGHVKVQDSRFSVGQNLHYNGNFIFIKGGNWTGAIDSWFNEYDTYRFGTSEYNHYTQLVWANTNLVGCGYTMYSDPNRPNFYRKYHVCNYGPAGNVKGQTPYKVGAGCENLC